MIVYDQYTDYGNTLRAAIFVVGRKRGVRIRAMPNGRRPRESMKLRGMMAARLKKWLRTTGSRK